MLLSYSQLVSVLLLLVHEKLTTVVQDNYNNNNNNNNNDNSKATPIRFIVSPFPPAHARIGS